MFGADPEGVSEEAASSITAGRKSSFFYYNRFENSTNFDSFRPYSTRIYSKMKNMKA